MPARSLVRSTFALVMLIPLVAIMACGSDKATGPDVGDVAGSYDATTLTASVLGTDYDMLEMGASIHLVLDEDGTTTGHLLVPASALTGDEVDEELAGTWSLSGSTVTLSQTADTFIRDVPLTVEGTQLIGDQTVENVAIHVVLDRQ